MKTPAKILKEKITLHRTLNINEGSPLHIAVIEAMEEHANEAVDSKTKTLRSALEDAVIGLEWEIETRAGLDNKANEEKLHEWREILKTTE